MTEIDYYKGRIDYFKVIMTALLGVLFIIFWNVMAYPDITKNMDIAAKGFVFLFVSLIILAILLIMHKWHKILINLKDA